MPDLVSFDLHEGVATLTLDDGKANALSLAMSRAIDAGLDRAAREARVVIIHVDVEGARRHQQGQPAPDHQGHGAQWGLCRFASRYW